MKYLQLFSRGRDAWKWPIYYVPNLEETAGGAGCGGWSRAAVLDELGSDKAVIEFERGLYSR